MALLTEFPLWLVIFVILLGAGYALFLYFKNNTIVFEKKPKIVMACLRGIAMSLLAFLLLAPMLKMIRKQVDKPLILVAVDNSESVVSGKDSAYYRTEYAKQVQELITELEKSYEVKTYTIGDEDALLGDDEQLSLDFSDKSSNLASLFDQVDMVYANRNVGAMILLTDGIFNTGTNPYYKAEKVDFPVYTVGLGNTELTTDFFIAGINHNKQLSDEQLAHFRNMLNLYLLKGGKIE